MPTLMISLTVTLSVAALLTLRLDWPPAVEAAQTYFTPDEIARGRAVAISYRLLYWSGQAVTLALLTALVATGANRALADLATQLAQRWGISHWGVPLLIVAATVAVFQWLATLPAGLAGHRLSHEYGLAAPEYQVHHWLADRLTAGALSAVMGAVMMLGLYALMRGFPRLWPWLAGLGAAVLAIAVAIVWPVVVAPIWNTHTPLHQTPWRHLEPAVTELANRAGVSVGEVFVADAGRRSRHANAYFAGIASTRRIVLDDTLLETHPPDEVAIVVAHEIGHWQYNHVLWGVVLGCIAGTAGLVALRGVLCYLVRQGRCGLREVHDPAGWPVVLLLAFAGTWLSRPAHLAVSRYFERQADAVSLELTNDPAAFVAAERRLALGNLSELAPNPITVWLLASHPPVGDRIAAAERFAHQHGRPLASQSVDRPQATAPNTPGLAEPPP